jgi:hypothetical protein
MLLITLWASPAAVAAQEDVIPPPVGGGTSYTRTANGQVIEVTTVGPVEVIFTEISAARVRGQVVRLDQTTTTAQATIRWVNLGVQQTITVDIGAPLQPFCMESGDIDRRSNPNQIN